MLQKYTTAVKPRLQESPILRAGLKLVTDHKKGEKMKGPTSMNIHRNVQQSNIVYHAKPYSSWICLREASINIVCPCTFQQSIRHARFDKHTHLLMSCLRFCFSSIPSLDIEATKDTGNDAPVVTL